MRTPPDHPRIPFRTEVRRVRCIGRRLVALTLAAGSSLLLRAQSEIPDTAALPAQPGETVLVERLAGIVFRATPEAVVPDGVSYAGYDVSTMPLLQGSGFAAVPEAFLGRPLSFESGHRIALATRLYLQQLGYPFVAVFVPPQAIVGDTIQIVVAPSRFDELVRVEGARHFPEAHYRRALRQEPGRPLHVSTLAEDINWLNRHPYHRVAAVVEPGAEPGSSVLVLKVQESIPFRFSFGYDNTGTAVTDEDRLFAGVEWGNAFGRGDSLGYQLRGDPALRRTITHSANYATALPWRHTLQWSGAWSHIESRLPAPFTQEGRSYQLGLRYDLNPRQLGGGWTGQWGFSADFKATDNTLEFAATPVTDNLTHVVQAGLRWTVSRRDARQNAQLTLALFGSPGGLTGRNDDAAFTGSRPGARASYLYGRLDGRYTRGLAGGFAWSLAASAQYAGRELLGSEQLTGTGSSAVRGYRESSAFGDDGAVVNAELHLPGFSPFKLNDLADLFAFLDGAVLGTNGVGGDITELASAGLGLNYQFGRHFSLRAAWGWTLKELPSVATSSGRGHVSASVNW